MARALARSGTGPVYEQIRRAIAAPIVAGRWRPGRRIPSEMELTKAFKASRMMLNWQPTWMCPPAPRCSRSPAATAPAVPLCAHRPLPAAGGTAR